MKSKQIFKLLLHKCLEEIQHLFLVNWVKISLYITFISFSKQELCNKYILWSIRDCKWTQRYLYKHFNKIKLNFLETVCILPQKQTQCNWCRLRSHNLQCTYKLTQLSRGKSVSLNNSIISYTLVVIHTSITNMICEDTRLFIRTVNFAVSDKNQAEIDNDKPTTNHCVGLTEKFLPHYRYYNHDKIIIDSLPISIIDNGNFAFNVYFQNLHLK